MTIIIGDAKGIDSNVQRYLIKKGYENVIIYFAGELIRNNIGNWHTILCQSGYFIVAKVDKNFEFMTAGDSMKYKNLNYINFLYKKQKMSPSLFV